MSNGTSGMTEFGSVTPIPRETALRTAIAEVLVSLSIGPGRIAVVRYGTRR